MIGEIAVGNCYDVSFGTIKMRRNMATTRWDSIWRDIRGERPYWQEPEERVIKLADVLWREGRRRVYDVGCGVGRHTVFMAKQGFEAYGSDLSHEALRRCRELLEREGLMAVLTLNDMEHVPYPDGFFDAVIAYHTIYHSTWGKLVRTVEALRKSLSSGGRLLASLRSTRDSACGMGIEVERNTFKGTSGEEESVTHHFCDEDELRELMQGFSKVESDLVEREHEGDGKEHRGAHWMVLASK